MDRAHWSRRTFLAMLGAAGVGTRVPRVYAEVGRSELALAAIADGIHTLRLAGDRWSTVAHVAALRPAALALSPGEDRLYVANAVARCGSLPTGSVTTYQVAGTGALTLRSVTPLALSGEHPYALAVSPDGQNLATASRGGVVSLLSLQGGMPQAVVAARKYLGEQPLGLAFVETGVLRVDLPGRTEFYCGTQDFGFQQREVPVDMRQARATKVQTESVERQGAIVFLRT